MNYIIDIGNIEYESVCFLNFSLHCRTFDDHLRDARVQARPARPPLPCTCLSWLVHVLEYFFLSSSWPNIFLCNWPYS